jgi:hypothetical protein
MVDMRCATQTGTGVSSSVTGIGKVPSAINLTGPLALRSRQTFCGAANASATLTADDACCYTAAIATTGAMSFWARPAP